MVQGVLTDITHDH